MRRLAIVGGILAALLLSTGARAAEVQVDEFTATAGTREFIPSNITLQAGRKYRMIISGTMTQAQKTVTSSLDTVYCFESSQGGCKPPSEAMALSVAFEIKDKMPDYLGGVESFAELGDEYKVPDYDPDHTYETVFTKPYGGKLWVVSPPFTDDGSTSSGSWRIRLFTEEAKPKPSGGGGGSSGLGDAQQYSAPAPGGGLLLSSPTLGTGLRSLAAAVAFTGAAPSRTFAASALRITDGRKMVSMCAVWGSIGAPAKAVHLAKRLGTVEQEREAGLVACTKAVQRHPRAASGGCRLSLVPVLVPHARLTASQRRAAVGFVRRNLATTCSSSANGPLAISLRSRTDAATMPALLGSRMRLAVVRDRTASADGANPKLQVRWSA
jgi:hypothetical protein